MMDRPDFCAQAMCIYNLMATCVRPDGAPCMLSNGPPEIGIRGGKIPPPWSLGFLDNIAKGSEQTPVPGVWLQVDDREMYGEDGATVCSKCHYAMNNGVFFEPWMFEHCPHCGSPMIRTYIEYDITRDELGLNKITRSDNIRWMTDEEMAEFFEDLFYPNCMVCPARRETCDGGWDEDCRSRLLEWLQQKIDDKESAK